MKERHKNISLVLVEETNITDDDVSEICSRIANIVSEISSERPDYPKQKILQAVLQGMIGSPSNLEAVGITLRRDEVHDFGIACGRAVPNRNHGVKGAGIMSSTQSLLARFLLLCDKVLPDYN